MKVFVAGATGVLGRRLVRRLTGRGHTVVGLARSPEKARWLREAGATPCEASLFDVEALTGGAAGCEVVVHAATAIPKSTRSPDAWSENDRIRREGAQALTECAGNIGARAYVQQSVVWVANPPGGEPFDEDSPVCAGGVLQSAVDSERIAVAAATRHGFEVGVLRCGWFYGADAGHTKMIRDLLRKRMIPLVGGGRALWCCLHLDDAAAAFAAAIEQPRTGVWHVVDDAPVTTANFFREFARLLHAKPPRRLPAWLVRLLAGKDDVEFFTRSTQTTSVRFRHVFPWEPQYPTYLEGLRQVVDEWKRHGA